jgi:hypothetical protein
MVAPSNPALQSVAPRPLAFDIKAFIEGRMRPDYEEYAG